MRVNYKIYTGLFAFGLFDASLITIAAHYLWRVAISEDHSTLTRGLAATIALPIIVIENIAALALLVVLALPIVA